MIDIDNFMGISSSGDNIYTSVSEKLIENRLLVVTRKKEWNYIKEKEFQLSGIHVNQNKPQVLVYINIAKYEIDEKKLVPVTIEDHGTTTTTKTIKKKNNPIIKHQPKINGKGKQKPVIVDNIETTEKTITTKHQGKTTHTQKYTHSQAYISINLRMIDIKTGKVIWTSESDSTSIKINISIRNAVYKLLEPFFKLRS